MDARELTKQDLAFYLSNIAYSYQDGYKPKDFPLEFGSDEYWKALSSVADDMITRISKRYGLE